MCFNADLFRLRARLFLSENARNPGATDQVRFLAICLLIFLLSEHGSGRKTRYICKFFASPCTVSDGAQFDYDPLSLLRIVYPTKVQFVVVVLLLLRFGADSNQ